MDVGGAQEEVDEECPREEVVIGLAAVFLCAMRWVGGREGVTIAARVAENGAH